MIKKFNNKKIPYMRLSFENETKILPFCKGVENSILSEQDIINLFLGFIRLIKRSAVVEVEQKYKQKLKDLTEKYHSLKNAKSVKNSF